ncbi:hypothetical protein C8R43DRAFT_1210877 [Mycena crocata]|nr:hypothetical protein C8R43DRAFT_1210877 [Mycena crocata]
MKLEEGWRQMEQTRRVPKQGSEHELFAQFKTEALPDRREAYKCSAQSVAPQARSFLVRSSQSKWQIHVKIAHCARPSKQDSQSLSKDLSFAHLYFSVAPHATRSSRQLALLLATDGFPASLRVSGGSDGWALLVSFVYLQHVRIPSASGGPASTKRERLRRLVGLCLAPPGILKGNLGLATSWIPPVARSAFQDLPGRERFGDARNGSRSNRRRRRTAWSDAVLGRVANRKDAFHARSE